MRRLADGERAAMDEVYRGIAPRLRPLCVRMLGDTAEVADVIQQVLIDLFERASEYDTERDALSWALTITVWHCRSERKRRTRRRSVSLAEGTLPPADDNPEEELLLRRDRDAFAEAAGALEERDREVLEAILAGAPLSAAFRKRKERMLVRLKRMLLGADEVGGGTR